MARKKKKKKTKAKKYAFRKISVQNIDRRKGEGWKEATKEECKKLDITNSFDLILMKKEV